MLKVFIKYLVWLLGFKFIRVEGFVFLFIVGCLVIGIVFGV